MPIKNCEVRERPGYKWGDNGKCFTYRPGVESERREARRKAAAVGAAIWAASKEKDKK